MRKHLIYIVAVMAVAVMATGLVSYSLGSHTAQVQLQEMQGRLDSLLAKQRDAVVTKRWSNLLYECYSSMLM